MRTYGWRGNIDSVRYFIIDFIHKKLYYYYINYFLVELTQVNLFKIRPK